MPARRWSGIGLITIVALCFLAGCGEDLESDDSRRDEAGNVTEGGDVGASALQVGDCITSQTGSSDEEEEVDQIPVVPCAEPHTAEVYATFDLPGGGDYPGKAEVGRLSEAGCVGDRFTAYIGLSYTKSEIGLIAIYPTEDSWEGLDDREVVCMAAETDGRSTAGSVNGASR